VAQQVSTRLVDDIDGSEAAETVAFGLDAASYEIDLNTDHAAKLREAFASYVAVARRAGGSSSAPRRQSATRKRSRDDLPEVRAWLTGNGYPVKDRGRINDGWLADYDAKSPNPPQQAAPGDKQLKREVTTVTAPVFQAV
jgi:Lsr2